MLAVNATDVRKDFGRWIDTIVRKRPVIVKRSRDYFFGISLEAMKELVKDVEFTVLMDTEDNGDVVLVLKDFGIVESGTTYEEALQNVIDELREYTKQYFDEIEIWGRDAHRRTQLKELMKIICTESDNELKGCFKCQHGEI